MIISFNYEDVDYLNIDTEDEISVKMVSDLIGEDVLNEFIINYEEPLSESQRLYILEKKLEESQNIITELLSKIK